MPKAWQPIARGRGKMSFANLGATPGYGQGFFIGRAMCAVYRAHVAEAENNADDFVLVIVPTKLSANTSNEE